MILDNFSDEMNRTISVYPKEQMLDSSGRIIESFAAAPIYTDLKSAIWSGATAETLVSDQYKSKFAGVAVLHPGATIPTGSKIIVDDGRTFYSIPPDDVMTLGEVLIVGLQNGV